MSDLVQLQPYDSHNQKLESHVHPTDWQNPKPTGRYNLVVVGAGPAGLITAIGAAGLGAKVALVERELLGGDCLNVGCVPSKGVISAARVAAVVRDASQFGIHVPDGVSANFAAIMERVRRQRADLSHHDAAARMQELGIDVFIGAGTFFANGKFEVGGQQLSYKRAVICTGARAAKPPIPGLDDIDYLTNESLFSLIELPERLIVVGGGPIGSEMAQSFARFGSQVTQIEMAPHILSREEADAALVVQQSMTKDGISFLLNSKVTRVEKRGSEIVVVVEQDGREVKVHGDRLLLAIGRSPNVENMGLEAVGVRFDARHGIEVDDRLRTTNSHIYAAGDVCSKFKFTHSADFMARIVIQNTLFRGRAKASSLLIPWATYTSPEIAHVGLYPSEAEQQGLSIDTYTQQFTDVDRAVLEGEDEGFVRVHTKRGTDKILGATIVATNAGDMICEITLAMKHGIGLGKIASTIHPYPTQAEAIRKLGDQYNRTRLTPLVKGLFAKWLAWTR